VNARGFAVILTLTLVVAACGSSPSNSVKSGVAAMSQVLKTYNAAHPADLAATGSDCRRAYVDLGSRSSGIVTASVPANHRREVAILRHAYRLARAGFFQCSRAAASLNYPEMASAQQAIHSSNALLCQARALDH
jgi:hypothetical protein